MFNNSPPLTHLIIVLIALKSALPLIGTSFNPHVNWTLELIPTNFQGASLSAVDSTSSTGVGTLGRVGADPGVVPAASAAAAVAAMAGCTRLNLTVRWRGQGSMMRRMLKKIVNWMT